MLESLDRSQASSQAPTRPSTTGRKKILIKEGLAKPMACVGQQGGNGPIADRVVESVDTLYRGEVCLNRLRISAEHPKILCGVNDFGLIGGDHQIETILSTKL